MLKVLTVIGTRPELIKMSRVIAEFDRHTHHILVHTGQNYDYELNKVFFEDLEIREPDYFLNVKSETAAKTIANIIEKIDEVLAKEKPDAFMVYGDTNSCLAVIAAKRRKIPIFHMEAGNRCFDLRVPEEINRKIVDHLSDVNMVLSEHARRYLITEGISPDLIFKTGSHMQEVFDFYMPKISQSKILEKFDLEPRKYFIVSLHREENVDVPENLSNILESLQRLYKQYSLPILFSTHPRTQNRLKELDKDTDSLEGIKFVKPFGFCDYINLQMNSFCALSDSGTITEESSLLNFPAVTLRNSIERPEGMDEGVLFLTGLKPDHILDTIQICINQWQENKGVSRIVKDYLGGIVSSKVLKIVRSYTNQINWKVWYKND